MGSKNWVLLGRLKTAVKKIKFLLNQNANRWRIASYFMNSSRGKSSNRRLSFNEWPRGLLSFTEESESGYQSSSPPAAAVAGGVLSRTISGVSSGGGGTQSEDDIDKKADLFIANFYRQLRIERQISLELQYCRGNNSFNSLSP
ncbi:uncharacterized protein LOC124912599 [Impatiens glandulifera]|uniref:uncharacterized protein LOC124912599 n=1 Tax=Impatiens glandulifera TaxID=253017 RepID=UPI001FB052E7|nr:uncharacterized protein LOC124912599 [Impatiens glandulifera]